MVSGLLMVTAFQRVVAQSPHCLARRKFQSYPLRGTSWQFSSQWTEIEMAASMLEEKPSLGSKFQVHDSTYLSFRSSLSKA